MISIHCSNNILPAQVYLNPHRLRCFGILGRAHSFCARYSRTQPNTNHVGHRADVLQLVQPKQDNEPLSFAWSVRAENRRPRESLRCPRCSMALHLQYRYRVHGTENLFSSSGRAGKLSR